MGRNTAESGNPSVRITTTLDSGLKRLLDVQVQERGIAFLFRFLFRVAFLLPAAKTAGSSLVGCLFPLLSCPAQEELSTDTRKPLRAGQLSSLIAIGTGGEC